MLAVAATGPGTPSSGVGRAVAGTGSRAGGSFMVSRRFARLRALAVLAVLAAVALATEAAKRWL